MRTVALEVKYPSPSRVEELSFYTSICYMNLINLSEETKEQPKSASRGFRGQVPKIILKTGLLILQTLLKKLCWIIQPTF